MYNAEFPTCAVVKLFDSFSVFIVARVSCDGGAVYGARICEPLLNRVRNERAFTKRASAFRLLQALRSSCRYVDGCPLWCRTSGRQSRNETCAIENDCLLYE